MAERFDARAWLLWVLCAAALTIVVRNPIYTLLLLVISRLVDWTCGDRNRDLALPLARIAVIVLLFSGLFSALFVHSGDVTLLHLPDALPLVGGSVTAEAFMSGLANGLLLLTLLSLFVTFNRVVSGERLARLAPRAFQDLGIVTLIALTYVPETTRQVARIREAQAVRGHHIEGVRDWQPLIIPLLIGGLERAMALAEAMVARGFGATERAPLSAGTIAVLTLATGLTFGGWIVALWWGVPGWILMGAGVILLLATIWHAGRGVVVTHYRRRTWSHMDTALIAASLLPLTILTGLGDLFSFESLFFSFLNGLTLPDFEPAVATLLLFYLLPALYAFTMDGGGPEDSNDND